MYAVVEDLTLTNICGLNQLKFSCIYTKQK